jgi:hypothetical protein
MSSTNEESLEDYIVNTDNISVDPSANDTDLTFSDPRPNRNGGNTVYVNLRGGRPVIIPSPKLRTPFGWGTGNKDDSAADNIAATATTTKPAVASETTTAEAPVPSDDATASDADKLPNRIVCDASLDDWDTDAAVGEFKTFMENFDMQVKLAAVKNTTAWFKKKFTMDFVDLLYKPTVREPTKAPAPGKKPYAPSLRFKIPIQDGDNGREVSAHLFDYKNTEILKTYKNLVKNGYLKPIIQCTGIWFVQGSFGASWQVVQGKVYPPRQYQPKVSSFKRCAIPNDDKDDHVDPESSE